MIPILSLAIRKDYQKVRDALHQSIYDKNKAYMRRRRDSFVTDAHAAIRMACADENQLMLMSKAFDAAMAHWPTSKEVARHTIESIDGIVYKKTEVTK
ncbi:hypothetical protein [Sulfuricurvum sp.]|uniref:hypothetical protein n=1 Tax=Sulfuricurvum sp. TaxID=2025608 RepID=UPI0035657A9A